MAWCEFGDPRSRDLRLRVSPEGLEHVNFKTKGHSPWCTSPSVIVALVAVSLFFRWYIQYTHEQQHKQYLIVPITMMIPLIVPITMMIVPITMMIPKHWFNSICQRRVGICLMV